MPVSSWTVSRWHERDWRMVTQACVTFVDAGECLERILADDPPSSLGDYVQVVGPQPESLLLERWQGAPSPQGLIWRMVIL